MRPVIVSIEEMALRIEHERQEAAAAVDHLYGLLCEAVGTIQDLIEYLPERVAEETMATLDRIRIAGGMP